MQERKTHKGKEHSHLEIAKLIELSGITIACYNVKSALWACLFQPCAFSINYLQAIFQMYQVNL